MKISIIVPTHNRASQLEVALNSFLDCRQECDLEIVVVDNNSSDTTRDVCTQYSNVVYVFEPRTAFSRARKTGAENASGDIFVFVDDDIILDKGSLREIIRVFDSHPNCGLIAGRINPYFIEQPPEWAISANKKFNGWSLFNPEYQPYLSDGLCSVNSACGPLMAVRRSVYFSVDGFPPDIIGVESNKGERQFFKLYIGPGDYGLSQKVTSKHLKILYSPSISCSHVIQPFRSTRAFWRSRLIGEGQHIAITAREFYSVSPFRCFLLRCKYLAMLRHSYVQVLRVLSKHQECCPEETLSKIEIDYNLARGFLSMDRILQKHPKLSRYLWNIATKGVTDDLFDEVLHYLPEEYLHITSRQYIYSDAPLTTHLMKNQYTSDICLIHPTTTLKMASFIYRQLYILFLLPKLCVKYLQKTIKMLNSNPLMN